jgi:hypothetical protein
MSDPLERLRAHVLRYADSAGCSPAAAAARLLAHYVGKYRSREDAIDHANHCLIEKGLVLVDNHAREHTAAGRAVARFEKS